jgi:MFS family permease
MVYNALITYTMALRLRTGVMFALLFTVAMGLHFVLTDRGLREHYPRRFDARGRAALAAALLIGWALSALLAPTSTVLVALLTALLGGSILLNVFKEEIPSNRSSSFGWFLTGLTVYAGLLALVTALAE